MTESDTPRSGSRWEPAGTPAQPPPTRSRRFGERIPTRLPSRLRGRTALIAASVVLLALAGGGGVAIDQAVAHGDGPSERSDGGGRHGHGDGYGDGRGHGPEGDRAR